MDLDDYVFKAVKTGLDMAGEAVKLEEEIRQITGKKIGFGVGINCGEAVVGNVGTLSRMDYTAIGNTVNIAARLESQAEAGEVVISQQVYERLKGRSLGGKLGGAGVERDCRGMEVYRVLGVEG